MREIKFRAWDKMLSRMKYIKGFIIYGDDEFKDWFIELHFNGFSKHQRSEIELMQYTGLKDKNGKEIYEGDLIIANTSYENGNDEYEWTEEKPCIVQWHEKATGFFPITLNSRWRCDLENIEVLGNIYETKINIA